VIWAYISSLIPPRVLSATVMQTSQGCGTRHLHLWTPVLPSNKVVGSFSMQDALSLGPQNFNLKLHWPLLKLSIAMSQAVCDVIPIMGLLQEMRDEISRFFVPSPTCIARF
jgi:hypothetical protein